MIIKLKKILLFVITGTVIFLGGGILIANIYSDEIESLAIEKINENLLTEVKVDKVNFSVLQKFPSASLEFENVKITSATNPEATVLEAEKLFLEFGLWQLIKGDYVINNMTLEEGYIAMETSKRGEHNFEIWKENKNDSEGSLTLDLENFEFKNIAYTYDHLKSNFQLKSRLVDLTLSAVLINDQVKLLGSGGVYVEELIVKNEQYIVAQDTKLKVDLLIDPNPIKIVFNNSEIEIGECPLVIEGVLNELEKEWNLALDANTNADIMKVLSALPPFVKIAFNDYSGKGKWRIKANVDGSISSTSSPTLTVFFEAENAQIKETNTGVAIKDIVGRGSLALHTGNDPILIVDNFGGSLGGSRINLKGRMDRFVNPWVNFDIQSIVNLDAMQKFLKWDTLDYLKGELNVAMQYKGPLKGNKISFDQVKAEGKVQCEDVAFKMKNAEWELTELNGTLMLNDEDIAVDGLIGKIKDSDFAFDGFFRNFIPFLLDDKEKVLVEANYHSDKLNLAHFFIQNEEVKSRNSELSLNFNPRIQFILNATIDELAFRSFRATEISGVFDFKNKMLKASPIQLKTADGEMLSQLSVKQNNAGSFSTECKATLNNINVTSLFNEFEEFGQTFITHNHLSGFTEAEVIFKSDFDQQLKINPKSVYALIDISIENGELISHQPMMDIATYLRKQTLVTPFIDVARLEKELKHLKFSRLKNQIEIKDETISVPDMTIASNAMDIELSGDHTFKHKIDYKVNFKLKELLVKNKSDSEFGYVVDDGTGSRIFLAMTGTAEDPDISMDKQAAQDKRQNDFAEEKQNLKELLNKEFGFFKKSTENKPEPDAAAKEVKFEVVDEDNAKNKEVTSNEKGLKKLFKKKTPKENNPEELKILIED